MVEGVCVEWVVGVVEWMVGVWLSKWWMCG